MNKERERTYLIVLSLLIICTRFVEITIDKINIFGNEATVSEGFIEIIFFILWVYFLWGFIQNYSLDFTSYRQSVDYKNALDSYTKHLISKKTAENNIDIEKWNVGKLSDGTEHGDGLSVPIYRQDNFGNRKELEPIYIDTVVSG